MKRHEKKPYSIYKAKTYLCETCGQMKNVDKAGTSSAKCRNLNFEKLENLNFEELEKNIESHVEEFNRKIYLGRKLKIIINKYGYNIHALSENNKDALKAYEQYGKK